MENDRYPWHSGGKFRKQVRDLMSYKTILHQNKPLKFRMTLVVNGKTLEMEVGNIGGTSIMKAE